MSYLSEHHRLAPVLELARRLDIATNPEPEAIYEVVSGGFQIWCIPEDLPNGWQGVTLIRGAFSKPCGFVACVSWGWAGDPELAPAITHLLLETDAFDLKHRSKDLVFADIRNRPSDIAWAEGKIHLLFQKAGVACPQIQVEAA